MCRFPDCRRNDVTGMTACSRHLTPAEKSEVKHSVIEKVSEDGDFTDTSLWGLDLRGVDFLDAGLIDTDLTESSIDRCDFSQTTMENTLLFRSSRTGARFPPYFNVKLLDKFDQILANIERSIDYLRKIEPTDLTWPVTGSQSPMILTSDEMRLAVSLAFKEGIKIDRFAEIQSSMNMVFGKYMEIHAVYLRRQFPSKIIEQADAELMKWLKAHPMDLYKLHPRTVESIVAEVFSSFGYDCELTAQTRDNGYDIIGLKHNGLVDTKILIEVKRWAPENRVGIGVVKNLLATMVGEQVSHGFVVVTSFFTKDAQKWANKFPYRPNTRQSIYQLRLVDFNELKSWIRGYSEFSSSE